MTEKPLTREQIELWRDTTAEIDTLSHETLQQLCTLALRGLAISDDPTAEMLEAGKTAWKKKRLHVNYQPADDLMTCGVIFRAMIKALEKP